VTVLRQRPGRPQLSSLDRLLWVWLYRIWPQVIDAMVLVKPATVVQWHRKGFRLLWRWRSRRSGRPKIGTEIRDLIRRVSRANPLWGAPRIHGELLKLGIEISQATVRAILVMKAAEMRSRCDGAERLNRPMNGSVLAQSPMSPRFIVVGGKLANDPAQMGLTEHDHEVETFPSDRADQSLRLPILPRRARSNRFVADAHGS